MNNNIIAVVNQKGGVGKTTSVINLASSLKQSNKKVLIIDMDPQGNATTAAGFDKLAITHSIYEVLVNNIDINQAILTSPSCGFDIITSNRHLSGAEVELVGEISREYKLKNALSSLTKKYDLILLDCPPSLGLLTLNALAAATYFLVPVQCEYYALEGLTDLLNTVDRLKININAHLAMLGIVATQFDGRNNLAAAVVEQLEQHFTQQLFKTRIPRNVRLAQAPSFGTSAVEFDINATGSQAYISLTKEILTKLKKLNIDK